ncbi:MAG: DUF805 domain-containing protein [Phocaeicola sp.]
MKWYLKVVNNYAQFNGRASRQEYWMFVLFNALFSCAAMAVDYMLGFTFPGELYGFIYTLYGLALFIPTLAVSVRRLHDVGKSGWMILISLIPLIGGIWLLVLECTAGNLEANKYGESPVE